MYGGEEKWTGEGVVRDGRGRRVHRELDSVQQRRGGEGRRKKSIQRRGEETRGGQRKRDKRWTGEKSRECTGRKE